jgi:hypothetical protein
LRKVATDARRPAENTALDKDYAKALSSDDATFCEATNSTLGSIPKNAQVANETLPSELYFS